jgi:hypothetical protein
VGVRHGDKRATCPDTAERNGQGVPIPHERRLHAGTSAPVAAPLSASAIA